MNQKKTTTKINQTLSVRQLMAKQLQKNLKLPPKPKWTIDRLTLSYVPEEVIGRTKQKKDIENFVKDCLASGSLHKVLYVTGTPGVGKTVSTLQILKKFQDNSEKKIRTEYLNVLSLKRIQQIYSVLFKIISNGQDLQISKKTASYKDKLEEIVPQLKTNIIFVIDEVDYLLTNDQDILYNLFEWTKFPKLACIIISNALDFPAKLKQRISSRVLSTIVNFKQYKTNQINDIILQRLEGCQLFDQGALKFLAMKIVNNSSDIRTVLSMLYTAVQQHKQTQTQLKISISDIRRIWQQKESIKLVTTTGPCIKGLHELILDYIKKHEYQCNSTDLYDVIRQKGVKSGDFMVLLKELQEMGYISITQKRNSMFPSYTLRLKLLYKE